MNHPALANAVNSRLSGLATTGRILVNTAIVISILIILVCCFFPDALSNGITRVRDPFIVDGGYLELGTVTVLAYSHGTIHLKNWRPYPITITSTETSCECTLAKTSVRLVHPFGDATLEVSVKPIAYGPATKMVVVHTDHGDQFIDIKFIAVQHLTDNVKAALKKEVQR